MPSPERSLPESRLFQTAPTDGLSLADRLTSAGAEAWSDLFTALPAPRRAKLGLRVERRASGVLLRSTVVRSPLVNRLIVTGRGRPVEWDDLSPLAERVLEGRPPLWVQVDAHAASPTLAERFAASGLERYPRDWMRLVRSIGPVTPSPCALGIRRATARDARAFGRLVASAFDLDPVAGPLFACAIDRPGWHSYVATSEGRVVAAAALFVDGDIGYNAFAATHPAHRGRGAQRALIGRRLQLASALGCRWVCSETGAPRGDDPQHSERNMRHARFVEAGRIWNFALSARGLGSLSR